MSASSGSGRGQPGDRGGLTGADDGASFLRRRGPHPVLTMLAVVGCLHLFFLLSVELNRNLVHNRELMRLSGEVAELRRELSHLDEIAAHGSDEAYREALARKQGFVYPHELLVVTQRR